MGFSTIARGARLGVGAALAVAHGIGEAAPAPADGATSITLTGAVDLTLLEQFQQMAEQSTAVIRNIHTSQWILAFLAILGGLALQRIIDYFMKGRMLRLASRTRFETDDVLIRAITRPAGYIPVTLGLILAGLLLGLRTGAGDSKTWFGNLAVSLLVINGTWICYNLVDVVSHVLGRLARRSDNNLDDQLVSLVVRTLRVLVLLLAVTTLGSWVGGPFKGILAGLGLGGLAFALAAKDTVSNLFGYAVIFADRPFRLGDVVRIGDTLGMIEELGSRSVRIRTFEKTLVIIPNSEVANATIENLSARPVRRVNTTVGLTYETTAEQMEEMVEAIRGILHGHEKVQKETFVVAFENFGESSLDIRMIYFSLEIEYAPFLQVAQEINLAVMRAVAARGLSIAFPTRTLYLRQDPDGVALGGFPPVAS